MTPASAIIPGQRVHHWKNKKAVPEARASAGGAIRKDRPAPMPMQTSDRRTHKRCCGHRLVPRRSLQCLIGDFVALAGENPDAIREGGSAWRSALGRGFSVLPEPVLHLACHAPSSSISV
jgi:hypothetical protein